MLILSRRAGESIILNENITLTVVSIKGKQVRIGIDAPDDVSVHREEVFQRILNGETTGYTPPGSKVHSDKSDGSEDEEAACSASDPAMNSSADSGGSSEGKVTILKRRRRSSAAKLS